MSAVTLNGINVHYEVTGKGPPLLMLAPGGFDAHIERWNTTNVWPTVRPLEALADLCTVIAYDRRESGQSGARVEKLTWDLYAAEARALLEHLGHTRAFIMGGCMGVSVALAFAARYPDACLGLVLHKAAGGILWHLRLQKTFADHAAYARQHGLAGVVQAARQSKAFMPGPGGGPWAWRISQDAAFAYAFLRLDLDWYVAQVEASSALFDSVAAPGASPAEVRAMRMPALLLPGDDESHGASASHYLKEGLPHVEYWDAPMPEQQGPALAERIRAFLLKHR